MLSYQQPQQAAAWDQAWACATLGHWAHLACWHPHRMVQRLPPMGNQQQAAVAPTAAQARETAARRHPRAAARSTAALPPLPLQPAAVATQQVRSIAVWPPGRCSHSCRLFLQRQQQLQMPFRPSVQNHQAAPALYQRGLVLQWPCRLRGRVFHGCPSRPPYLWWFLALEYCWVAFDQR